MLSLPYDKLCSKKVLDAVVIYNFSYIQALGAGFSPFAEPVFQRCISIIQSQQVAKVGQSVGEILLNSLSFMFSNRKICGVSCCPKSRLFMTCFVSIEIEEICVIDAQILYHAFVSDHQSPAIFMLFFLME